MSSPPEQDAPEPTPRELVQRVTEVLEAEMGRTSRWNGVVELVDDPFHSGLARFDGTIQLSLAAWADPSRRLRTVIHEALHQISQPTKEAYRRLPGWEEGVVEQLQRLLRRQVTATVGVPLNETSSVAIDAVHQYNRYIEALEEVRAALGREELVFYRMMLRTELAKRPEHVRDLLEQVPPGEGWNPFRAFIRVNACLRR